MVSSWRGSKYCRFPEYGLTEIGILLLTFWIIPPKCENINWESQMLPDLLHYVSVSILRLLSQIVSPSDCGKRGNPAYLATQDSLLYLTSMYFDFYISQRIPHFGTSRECQYTQICTRRKLTPWCGTAHVTQSCQWIQGPLQQNINTEL